MGKEKRKEMEAWAETVLQFCKKRSEASLEAFEKSEKQSIAIQREWNKFDGLTQAGFESAKKVWTEMQRKAVFVADFLLKQEGFEEGFDGSGFTKAQKREILDGGVKAFKEKAGEKKGGTLLPWLRRVRALCARPITSIEIALEQEQEAMGLMREWSENPLFDKEELIENDIDRKNLVQKSEQIAEKIARYCGFEEGVKSLGLSNQKRKEIARSGVSHLLRKEIATQMELRKHAIIQSPKDEFASVRGMKRHFVIHAGPTNSGKTHHAIEALKKAENGMYLAPTKALANETQNKLNGMGVPCDLLTGEEIVKTQGARHASSTIEMANYRKHVEVAVIDEAQIIADKERGYGWIRAVFGLMADEIHICGAPHAVSFIVKLIKECGDTYELMAYGRQTDLEFEEKPFLYPSSVQPGDALYVSTKGRVVSVAAQLNRMGIKAGQYYGKLPAQTKRQQIKDFTNGKTQVMVITDAIGIGVNLPIRRVVFLDTEKFDGQTERPLTTQEIKQIAGRAGRKGMYEKGFVNATVNREFIKEHLNKDEEDIAKSIIQPTIDLAKLNIGTLRERLTAWQQMELDVPYLEKANIEEKMELLKRVESKEARIGSENLFKTLHVSLDARDKKLVKLWESYVQALVEKSEALPFPKTPPIQTQKLLEHYYQELNLYYQFSKKFNLEMDTQKLYGEKRRVTSEITYLLTRTRRVS